MRKYNTFLDGMISNYRDLAKKAGLSTEKWNNEQLYAIIEETSGVSTNEEQEEYFLDLICERQ